MRNASQVLENGFPEMRWRCLSLAADLDRVQRAEGGRQLLANDPRLLKLREALNVLLADDPERAAKVQLIFSDKTPPPTR